MARKPAPLGHLAVAPLSSQVPHLQYKDRCHASAGAAADWERTSAIQALDQERVSTIRDLGGILRM